MFLLLLIQAGLLQCYLYSFSNHRPWAIFQGEVLEDANIKLTSVATSIQGVSARLMLEALIADEQSPEEIAQLAQRRMRSKIPQLAEALTGYVREHHRFMLQELLYQLDSLNQRIEALDQRIVELTKPHAELMERLDAITGVGPLDGRGRSGRNRFFGDGLAFRQETGFVGLYLSGQSRIGR